MPCPAPLHAAILLLAAIVSLGGAVPQPSQAQAPGAKAIAFRKSKLATQPHSFSAVCQDLNNDTRPDLVFTHPRLGLVSVCLGKGDGSFAACRETPHVGKNPRGLVVSDFNRDGRDDLLVGASGDSAVVLLNGLGDGRFAAPRTVGKAMSPFMMTSADFNGDGIADAAVAEEQSGGVVTLQADGRGGFRTQHYSTGKWSSDVAAADFNEDGQVDLAVTNWGSNDVSILLGGGDGQFGAAHNITYEGEFWDHHAIYRVLAADLDRDGHVDMVWNDIIKQSLYIVYGDGTGAFPRFAMVPSGRGVRHASSADFDGDGWPDLVSTNTADNDVSIMLGDGHGGLARVQRIRIGRLPRTAVPCDVNADGRPDVVVTSMKDSEVTILINEGVTNPAAVEEAPLRNDPGSTLRDPGAVVVAPNQHILVADDGNHRIVSIDPASGALQTIAGTGLKGFGGDGKIATDAQLNRPTGLAVDRSGNIFVADTGNRRIRKIDTRGIISTIAGTGAAGSGGDGGPALSATMERPVSVAVDDEGRVFIGDASNPRLRVVDASGTISVAGTPSANAPAVGSTAAIAIGPGNAVFVADRLRQRVSKYQGAAAAVDVAGNGQTGSRGDGGKAVDAQLSYPSGLAVGSDGAIYIADAGNNAIRVVGSDGTIKTLAAAGGAPGAGTSARHDGGLPWQPSGVAVAPTGDIYFADRQSGSIRRIDPDGQISVLIGEESGGGNVHTGEVKSDTLALQPLTSESAPLDRVWEYVFESGSDDNSIYAIVPGRGDRAYIAGDVGTGADWRIQELINGTPGWQLNNGGPGIDIPLSLAAMPDGGLIATGFSEQAEGDRDALTIALTADGKERWRHAPTNPGMQACRAIATDRAGNAFAACESEGQWYFLSFDSSGAVRWQRDDASKGTPRGLSVASDGQIYVAGEEPHAWRVVKLNGDGTQVWQHRVPGRAVAYAVAATDDGGAIVVGSRADVRLKLRVERVAADGTLQWEYEAESPAGAVVGRAVAVDATGRAYVAGEIGSDWLMLGLDERGQRRWYFTYDGGGQLKNRDQPFAVALADDQLLLAGRIHRLPRIPPSLGQVEWRAVAYRIRKP